MMLSQRFIRHMMKFTIYLDSMNSKSFQMCLWSKQQEVNACWINNQMVSSLLLG